MDPKEVLLKDQKNNKDLFKRISEDFLKSIPSLGSYSNSNGNQKSIDIVKDILKEKDGIKND